MPNYGLLRDLKREVRFDPIGSALKGIESVQKPEYNAELIEQAKRNTALKDLEIQTAQENFKNLPELNRISLDTARQNLAFLPKGQQAELAKAYAAANSANAGADQHRAQANQIKQAAAVEKLTSANRIIGSLVNTPPEKRQAAYEQAKDQWANAGLDPNMLPAQWSPETEAYMNTAYAQTGDAMKMAIGQQKLAEIQARTDLAKARAGAAQDPGTKQEKIQEAKDFSKYKTEMLTDSKAASALKTELDAYEKSLRRFNTGPIKGRIGPWYNKDAQLLEKSANRIVSTYLPLIKGRITNNELAFLQKSTVTPTISREANREIIASMRATGERVSEKRKFILSAEKKGIKNPLLIESLWSQFMSENPIIDLETGKINKENIGNWSKYLDDSSISDAMSPASSKPSKEEYIATMQQANPGASLEQLEAAYAKQFGG